MDKKKDSEENIVNKNVPTLDIYKYIKQYIDESSVVIMLEYFKFWVKNNKRINNDSNKDINRPWKNNDNDQVI